MGDRQSDFAADAKIGTRSRKAHKENRVVRKKTEWLKNEVRKKYSITEVVIYEYYV